MIYQTKIGFRYFVILFFIFVVLAVGFSYYGPLIPAMLISSYFIFLFVYLLVEKTFMITDSEFIIQTPYNLFNRNKVKFDLAKIREIRYSRTGRHHYFLIRYVNPGDTISEKNIGTNFLSWNDQIQLFGLLRKNGISITGQDAQDVFDLIDKKKD